VLPAVNPLGVQPTDFGHARRLIRGGLTGARRRLTQPLDPASLEGRLRVTAQPPRRLGDSHIK
jgi:hypothetical protein